MSEFESVAKEIGIGSEDDDDDSSASTVTRAATAGELVPLHQKAALRLEDELVTALAIRGVETDNQQRIEFNVWDQVAK